MAKLLKRGIVFTLLIGIISGTVLTGCGSSSQTRNMEAAVEDATEEGAEGASTEAAAEVISEEELKAAFDKAVPYKDEVKVVINTASGEQFEPGKDGGNVKIEANASALNGSSYKWPRITGAAATSTLYIKGYDYSVWNMFDWRKETCWSEGNPYSEGTMEGFVVYTDYNAKINGFRIYPGYQKNRKTYKNNITPLALNVEISGYSIWCDLDNWLKSSIRDDEYYWIDIYFSSPIYSDGAIYVTIGAVTTFGKDPDYDCCISEFHPFCY